MKLLKLILIPFSFLYARIIFLRNKFYDNGFFKSHKVSKPVVSIGNITTGGTGKTPLTIFIAEYFLGKGKSVGIVSRGYKRKSTEIVIVCDGRNVGSIHESGDELNLMSGLLLSKYPDKIFTAAGSDRVKASELLIRKFNPDIIILDDAFQHRRIKRDLDIVLIDAAEKIKNNFPENLMLPSGNLRESYNGLSRSDIIIRNNKNENKGEIPELGKYSEKIVTVRYITEYFMDYKNRILDKNSQDVILFSGIAKNESFVSMVRSANMNIKSELIFSDHHDYTKDDMDLLKEKFSAGNIFITTEKDFVKIKHFKDFMDEYPVYYLKLKIEITDNKNFLYEELQKVLI